MQLRFQTAVRAEDSPAQKWPETSCAVHTNLISSKCHGGSRCSHWLWYQALQICGSGRMEVERSFFFFFKSGQCVCGTQWLLALRKSGHWTLKSHSLHERHSESFSIIFQHQSIHPPTHVFHLSLLAPILQCTLSSTLSHPPPCPFIPNPLLP